jgi:hypothetical protein
MTVGLGLPTGQPGQYAIISADNGHSQWEQNKLSTRQLWLGVLEKSTFSGIKVVSPRLANH